MMFWSRPARCSATKALDAPGLPARPLRSARDLADLRCHPHHRRNQHHPTGERDPCGRPLDDTVVLILHTWTYAGTSYTTTPGAQLALASAARSREHDLVDDTA